MTRIVAILFILAGLWKGWLDYADTLAEGYALEDAAKARVMASQDAREGPRAFMEKRPAVFRGK